MNILYKLITFCFISALTLPGTNAYTQERAMTLEDVMNFHHMEIPSISHNGRWLAYSAWPDRGDGYGKVVSSDKEVEYRVERGANPRFTYTGNWVLFFQRPSLQESEAGNGADAKGAAVVVKTSDGSQEIYHNIKSSSFSTLEEYLFIHKDHAADTAVKNGGDEKLKKAGSPLLVIDLAGEKQTTLPFVDRWTVDSLSSLLVFTVKDTVEVNNGLYYIHLEDLDSGPSPIDTTGNPKFGSFTWYEKESLLAYTRAEEMEKDTAETTVLYQWGVSSNGPDPLLEQEDAPEGYFLPFDNSLTWSTDGQRLFFGFRPMHHAASANEEKNYESVIDSIAMQADIDIWHGEDPFIKTHEKNLWEQRKRQNLISVFHINERRMVQLADEKIPDVLPSENGDNVLAYTSLPYSKRITWEGWFRDLYLMNLHTGEKQIVTQELRDQASLSPSAGYLVYFENNHWHALNISAGSTINLTAGIDVPFYDETDDTPSPPSSYRLAGWLDDGESVLIYDRYDIWRANARTGEMQNITAGTGRMEQTVFRIRKLDDRPLVQTREQLFIEGFNENTKVSALYSARPDRQAVSLIRDDGTNLRFRLLSGDEKTVVFSRESYNEYPDLWVTGTSFRRPVRVTRLGEQTNEFNWGTAELVSFTSADGIPLQGVVIKPGDYDPSKKYPVFVYYYEKFSQRLHQFNQTVINHRPSFAYYASNGYIVFLPDIHFKEGRPGMSAVNSLVPGVKKLIREGIADPDAIGLHGHSWSGYMTAYVVTQTDLFRAAIAGAPVSNMTSAYGGIRWGSGLARQFQYETGQSRLGSPLSDRRYLYIENSPLFYAHEINTPLLIMHGDVDEAVPWEQSIELYLAMRRAGKDIIFLQYRDEPHHPQKYPNKVDYTIRMKEYFDYHLRGYEPAGWIIDGVPYRGD